MALGIVMKRDQLQPINTIVVVWKETLESVRPVFDSP